MRSVGPTEQRRRVLIVAPSLDILGGQAIQADRLLAHLGQEPTLAVTLLPINPRLPGPLRALQRIKYIRTALTLPYYVATLLRSVPRHDVIHIFSASYLSFVLSPTPAILIARLFGRRTILNYRSGEADDHFRRWRRTAIPTVRLAHVIAVPSGYLVDVFRKHAVQAQAIFNFVDLEVFSFRKRWSLMPVLLSNRNFEPLYNVACTIEAFALVQAEFSNASLILAGHGSERTALEARVRALRLRNVTFVGKVRPEEMSNIYQQADIYLNSPNIDNMPTSIIEAFASGLPVVTSNAGGIGYIVEHERTGLIFEAGDHAAMAAHVLLLLRNQQFAIRLAENAKLECERYRWSAVRQLWLDLYHNA